MKRYFQLLVGVAVVALLGAFTLTTARPSAAANGVPAFSHIFQIVMENKEYSSIIGSSSAPYTNSLANQYGLATKYYGIRHPSLPNYLAMIGGDTFGITTDCTSCFVSATNLVDQLEPAGKTWKAYMESMPSPCFIGSSGQYVQKHNPFIYFDDIRKNTTRCNKIVPFTQFATDLQNNTVPNYAWITPNLCNDTHDCSINTGDNWLKTWVPKILASSAWKQNGVLFITYDEGSSTAGCCTYATGGHIVTLVISPLGKAAYRSTVAYDHYSLLHTIESAWGLSALAKAACSCSQPMSDFFGTSATTPTPTPKTPTPTAVATATPAPAGSNVILNPSFETAGASSTDAANWTEGTNHVRSNDRVHTGSWAMKSTFVGTGTSTRTAALPVKSNTTYTFSGWIYKASTSGAACIDMNDITGEVQRCATQTNVWQQVSGTWNSGSHTSVVIRLVTDGTPNGSIWFDDISLR